MNNLYKKIVKHWMLTALIVSTTTQVSFSQLSHPVPQPVPYTQNFNSFTGLADVDFPDGFKGWLVAAAVPSSGGRNNAPSKDKAITTGGSAANNGQGIYDFMGKIGLLSGTSNDNAIVVALNTTSITDPNKVKVTFDAMVMRNSYNGTTNNFLESMVFQYRIGTDGLFTSVDNCIKNGATTQVAGTSGIDIKTVTYILPAACSNQSNLQLRWVLRTISGSSGERPSFAFDNLSVTSEAPVAAAHFNGFVISNKNIKIINGTTYATNVLSGVTRTQELSKYGGAKTDYVGNPTGYFTTYKDARDVYYLIDPDGYKFYSLGVNTIIAQKGIDPVNTLKTIYSNTIGCFSDETIISMPYSVRLNLGAGYKNVIPLNKTLFDNGISPVFDADFLSYCAAQCASQITPARVIDKNLFGYFSDNELPIANAYSGPKLIEVWLNVANYGGQGVADANANYQAAVNWIKSRHGGVLVAPNTADKNEWPGQVAERYYSTCRNAIKAVDPNHLYIGSRLHQDLANPYQFDAAGKYVDVLSVNNYNVWTVAEIKARYDVWEANAKKPFIVSEFYAQAADSGLPNVSGAGYEVYTQQDRADFFEHYTMEMLKRKWNVGFQYFKFNDDPAENNKGLLNTDYEFWEPMKASYTEIAQDVYRLRDFLIFGEQTLPITLQDFTAKADGNRVKLLWSTVSETNNEKFEIQRAVNESAFKPIYTVKSKGANANSYLAYDDQPQTGINYYKLLQYDNDGTATEKGIRVVNFKLNAALGIKIFPNPANDEVNLQLTNFVGSSADVTLINMSGKSVHKETINTVTGENSYQLHLKSKLQPGQYILQVKGLGVSKSEKLIVL